MDKRESRELHGLWDGLGTLEIEFMKDRKTKLTRKKALLAIAFASGMLNSQLPVFPQSKVNASDSIEQRIVKNTNIAPEIRALYLLRLAREYVNNTHKSEVETRNTYLANEVSKSWTPDTWEMIVSSWTNQLPVNEEPVKGVRIPNSLIANSRPTPENLLLANSSINLALEQLDKSLDMFARLGLHFIAWRLYSETGNVAGLKRCSKALDADFENYKENETFDEEQINMTSSILNLLANSLIPVSIPNLDPAEFSLRKKEILPFTERDFKESEMLRRRAVEMTDRLDPQNDVRRKAHRDLVLWYYLLGKTETAEIEKQILFELVGIKDDSILYPQSGTCGHLVWWRKPGYSSGGYCGMG